MKNQLFSLFLAGALLLGTSCSHLREESKRDVAATSLITGAAPWIVAIHGIGTGVMGMNVAINLVIPNPNSKLPQWLLFAAMLVLLDDNRQVLVFQSLDQKTARKMGLSEEERKAYNDELALINLVSDEMQKQAKEIQEEDKDITPEKMQAEMKESYNKLAKEAGLSRTAQRALGKAIAHTFQKAAKQ